jgi:hypothetical protein
LRAQLLQMLYSLRSERFDSQLLRKCGCTTTEIEELLPQLMLPLALTACWSFLIIFAQLCCEASIRTTALRTANKRGRHINETTT